MRLWSLHPGYLDTRGLVALWRESLLARKVLEGKTTGYRYHPQLSRFRQLSDPLNGINFYLIGIFNESMERGYRFDGDKLEREARLIPVPVTAGQLEYETRHLLDKLRSRDPERYKKTGDLLPLEPHPLFKVVEGPVEEWEVL